MKTKIASVNDVPLGKSLLVKLEDGRDIALFNIDGKIYALNNACPHMGGPLNEGDIEGRTVTCPWHAWQFDIPSGECDNMPGENALSVEIEVTDGEIFLVLDKKEGTE